MIQVNVGRAPWKWGSRPRTLRVLRALSTVKEPERMYNGPIVSFLEGKPWETNFSVRDQTTKNPFSPKESSLPVTWSSCKHRYFFSQRKHSDYTPASLDRIKNKIQLLCFVLFERANSLWSRLQTSSHLPRLTPNRQCCHWRKWRPHLPCLHFPTWKSTKIHEELVNLLADLHESEDAAKGIVQQLQE